MLTTIMHGIVAVLHGMQGYIMFSTQYKIMFSTQYKAAGCMHLFPAAEALKSVHVYTPSAEADCTAASKLCWASRWLSG